MKLAIMQPYFFPYLGYFSLMESVDVFVVYDDVNFIRRGWINRNHFLGAIGGYRYTLPIKNASQNAKICDLHISQFDKQKKQFLASIEHSYKKAPYFNEVTLLLSRVFSIGNDNLASFLTHALECIANYIGVTTKILRSSELKIAQEKTRQARIIALCNRLNASTYINAAGGTELYDSTSFSGNNVELQFIQFEGAQYKQHNTNSFVANLSVIDGLMFNSPSELLSIIKRYSIRHG